MLRSRGVLLLAAVLSCWLLLVQQQPCLFCHGAWIINTLKPLPGVALREDLLSTDRIRVRFTCNSAQFAYSIASDRSIFMGSCSSNAPSNPFGFDRWRDFYTANRTVEVTRPENLDNTIELEFPPNFGYTLTQSEQITCIMSSAYVVIGDLGGDVAISFSVAASTNVYVQLQAAGAIPRRGIWWSTSPNAFAEQLTESTVRQRGLNVMVTIVNDAWRFSDLSLGFLANFSCDCPGDDAACGTLQGHLKTLSYITSDPINDPKTVRVVVPRSVMRLFNTKADVQLCLVVNRSVTYGNKQINLGASTVDTCFTLVANKFTSPPLYITRLFRNETLPALGQKGLQLVSIDVTENCIRGRNQSNACGVELFLFLQFLSGQEFTDTSQAVTDFAEVGFYSRNMQRFLSMAKGLRTASETVGSQLASINLFVSLVGDRQYQIDGEDRITVQVPFSAMISSEPPRNSVALVVSPSPGDVIGELPVNISQRELWAGTQTMRIHMGGERWIPDVVQNVSLFLEHSSGSRGSSAEGWGRWKSCVLPQGSLSFANVSGVVNDSILELRFQECPQYVVGGDEVVSFIVPAAFGVSGLGFNLSANLSFIVQQSPASFTVVTSGLTYTEDTIQTAQFTIQLQGGSTFRTPLTEACLASIRSSWTTNEPTDPFGWGNPAVRAGLLSAAVVQPDKFLTNSILVIALNQSYGAYANTRGERITIGALSNVSCVLGDKPVGPNQSFAITVRPRMPTVEVRLSRADDPQFVDRFVNGVAEITSTDMRSVDITMQFRLFNDTFRASASTVVSSFVTASPQPAGFKALRDRLLPLANVVMVNDTTISVRFQTGVLQYAITAAETVVVSISDQWVSSEQNVSAVSLVVLPSPGVIRLLSWAGGNSSSNQSITEDDVRAGRLWFQFALIGDQWRQERAPYVAMFSGPAGEGTGLLALIDQLVPSIEFFNFTSSDTFQYLTVTLQSSDVYDISATETVRIAFSADAASSGLAPQFDQGDGTFAFSIQPTAGRLVVSGQTQLTEKLIREGGSTIFLTLFGDQWVALGATECVRQNTRITTSASRAALFEASILPSTAFMLVSTRVMSIRFEGDRRYVLPSGSNSVDLLVLLPNASCFRGKQLPPQLPVTVSITKTRGELSVAARRVAVSPLGVPQLTAPSQFDLDESALRSDSTATVVEVVVDGNAWNLDGLAYTPSEHRDVSLGDLLQRPTPCTCGDLWNATLPMDAYSGGLYCACSAPPTNATEGRGSNVTLRCPSSNLLSLLADAAATSPASGVQLPVCNASISLGLSATTWLASYEVQCHCNETTHHDTPPMLPDVRLPAAFNGSIVAPTIRTHCVCSLIDGDYNVTAERLALLDAGWVYSGLSAVDVLVNVSRLRILLRSALASSASPLEEPAGFAAKKDQIVLDTLTPRALSTTTAGSSATTTARNVVHVLVNATTLTIALAAAASYDIIEDEAISFTLTDPSLMSDGLAPDPASASFAVAALPLTVGMVYQPPGGQFSGAVLQSGVGSVLSMGSTTDAAIRVVQTGRRGIAFVVELQFNVTPSSVDPRTNAELTNHLLALSSTFLTSNLGVLCAVVNGTNCSVREADDGGAEGAATSDATSPVVWFFATVAVVVVVGLLTYVSLVFRNTKLSGSMRRKFEEPGEPVPYVDGGGPKSAERIPIADVAQPPMSLREFVKRRNMTTSDDVYFTERDLQALEDEPDSPDDGSGWAAARADPRRQTLDAVMEEQRRSQRVDEQVLRRRSDSSGGATVRTAAEGARRAQRAVDLRADFQL